MLNIELLTSMYKKIVAKKLIFGKINEFQKSEGTGHAGCRNDAVLGVAKIDTSSRILSFKNFDLLQNNCDFHKRRDIAAAGTRKRALPEAAKIDLPFRIFVFFSHFLRPSTACHIFTPVTSRPHIPRPKDCPG